jgi:hypothetical protein
VAAYQAFRQQYQANKDVVQLQNENEDAGETEDEDEEANLRANLDPDKRKLFTELRNACSMGEADIIESIFSSQRDDAVSKELLMAKTSVWV